MYRVPGNLCPRKFTPFLIVTPVKAWSASTYAQRGIEMTYAVVILLLLGAVFAASLRKQANPATAEKQKRAGLGLAVSGFGLALYDLFAG